MINLCGMTLSNSLIKDMEYGGKGGIWRKRRNRKEDMEYGVWKDTPGKGIYPPRKHNLFYTISDQL